MKHFKSVLTLLILACAAASGVALAHGRVGIYVGPGYGWYYPPPYYYYYPPPVVVREAPPVYIERDDDDRDAGSASWYYCRNPAGYYPTVKQCPGGWEQVRPQPPAR